MEGIIVSVILIFMGILGCAAALTIVVLCTILNRDSVISLNKHFREQKIKRLNKLLEV